MMSRHASRFVLKIISAIGVFALVGAVSIWLYPPVGAGPSGATTKGTDVTGCWVHSVGLPATIVQKGRRVVALVTELNPFGKNVDLIYSGTYNPPSLELTHRYTHDTLSSMAPNQDSALTSMFLAAGIERRYRLRVQAGPFAAQGPLQMRGESLPFSRIPDVGIGGIVAKPNDNWLEGAVFIRLGTDLQSGSEDCRRGRDLIVQWEARPKPPVKKPATPKVPKIARAPKQPPEKPKASPKEPVTPKAPPKKPEEEDCPCEDQKKVAIVLQGSGGQSFQNDVDRMRLTLWKAGFGVLRLPPYVEPPAIMVGIFGPLPSVVLGTSPKETMKNMLDIIRGSNLGPCDKLFIYYSGHGMATHVDWWGPDIVFDPKDAEEKDAKMTDLLNEIKKSGVGHFNLMIDSCYSGAVIPFVKKAFSGTRKKVNVFTSAAEGQECYYDRGIGYEYSTPLTKHLSGLLDKRLSGEYKEYRYLDLNTDGCVSVEEFERGLRVAHSHGVRAVKRDTLERVDDEIEKWIKDAEERGLDSDKYTGEKFKKMRFKALYPEPQHVTIKPKTATPR